MALVLGTNVGFVTTAPTADPEGTSALIDTRAIATKDTSPGGNNKITEIGWYANVATEESNFEVGIYTDNGALPDAVVGSLSQTNAKGTDAGWKVVTGLDITISPNTTYWIAAQLDDTATTTNIDFSNSNGFGARFKTASTLTDPFGATNDAGGTAMHSIYAKVVEDSTPSATDNMTIIGENIY